jgi:hypothetical protein
LAASVGTHLLDEGFLLNVVETGPAQFTGRTGAGRTGNAGSASAAFDLPGGDQLLLASLASVRQTEFEGTDYVGIVADALRRGGHAVPMFLILADGELSDLAALATLRHQCEPAVAFLFGPARALAEGRLADEGWTCVPVDDGARPEDVWRDAARRHSAAMHGG